LSFKKKKKSFSNLKRIKSYLRNTVSQVNLVNIWLCWKVISIELNYYYYYHYYDDYYFLKQIKYLTYFVAIQVHKNEQIKKWMENVFSF